MRDLFMAQAVYHYIKNYSSAGKIGISYMAISDMIKETLKDENPIWYGVNFEAALPALAVAATRHMACSVDLHQVA